MKSAISALVSKFAYLSSNIPIIMITIKDFFFQFQQLLCYSQFALTKSLVSVVLIALIFFSLIHHIQSL